MKKHLIKLLGWFKRAFRREVEEEIIKKEIPVEDAFRMWKEHQKKNNS